MKKHLSQLSKMLGFSMVLTVLVALVSAAFVVPAQASEAPEVDLSNIRYGTASFEADGSAAAKASLKTTSGVKIYLNVQAKPMTKKQIKPGTCRKAPVGKKFFNEIVDPATGKHYFKPWRVQAGDNVFCKGRDGKWRKKSCNNIAKGIFGVKKPPKRLIRVKAHVQNYLTWSGELELESEQSGSARAYVVQYDENGNKVCEAESSVSGSIYAYVRQSVKVRSRTMLGISLTAANQAEVKASADTTVKGMLEGKVRTHLEGEATAMCNYTPPEEEQPPTEEKPAPMFAQFREINDVYVNATTDHCVTVDFPDGNSGTVHWTAKYGSFATTTKSAQDMVQVCSTYKAPSEVPSSGTDTITVTATDSVTGKSVTKTTDPFLIKAMPATP